jgi:hypothetical protein
MKVAAWQAEVRYHPDGQPRPLTWSAMLCCVSQDRLQSSLTLRADMLFFSFYHTVLLA